MASHGVHANPKGIFFSIGSLFPDKVLAAGPSNSGLADAGDGAARSLFSVSSSPLHLSQSLDYQVGLRAMTILVDEIGAAFLQAHQRLYRDELKLRKEDAEAKAILAEHGITEEDMNDFSVILGTQKGGRRAAQTGWRPSRAKGRPTKRKSAQE